MAKKMIAFVTGGYSGEAVVSYKSAKTIQQNIDLDLFDYVTIDIRKDGWWYVNESGIESSVDKNDFSILVKGEKRVFDAVLIGIHGSPGEDGKLQGYFDMLGLPYTTCDASVSSLTFNKRYTVAVAAMAGIDVARSLHFYKGDYIDLNEISAKLSFPLFIKPANGGSSIGMSKVPDLTGVEEAIEKAFREDSQVLVEEFVKGREFTLGVFRDKGEIITLPMTEVISENYFFDFEAKYHGKNKEITPAEIDESKADKIRFAAKYIYKVFRCKGVIRIDFIYNDEKDRPFMLEINTVPGQSEASIVPQQVVEMGWDLKSFYTSLIMQALEEKSS